MTRAPKLPENQEFEALKFEHQMALEHRKLDIAEFELKQLKSKNSFTFIHGLLAALGALAGGLLVALVNAQSALDIKNAETAKAIELQQSIAALELERQSRQQRFDIIVQATKDVKRDIASDNLLFFVEAGILPDDEGNITAMAERGAAPELGSAPRVNDLSISEEGLDLIKQFLPLSLNERLLPDGRKTIGFSHDILETEVTLSDGRQLDLSSGQIIYDEANALLLHDLVDLEESINNNIRIKLYQNQFDALMSLITSIGIEAFEGSELLRAINKGKLDDVPALFRNWVNLANVPIQELKDRRELEVMLWSSEQ